MNFTQTQFAQALETAGFRRDRSVYQNGAQFYIRKFGRQAVIVSVYPHHYTATLCQMSPNGYVVKDQVMLATDHHDLINKMAQWGLVD